MQTQKVMLNGLPGNVAAVVARHIIGDDRFRLLPHSLTGPEIAQQTASIEEMEIRLYRPEQAQEALKQIISSEAPFITIDYTHPSAVNQNASLYCKLKLPFVMGTTGGNRAALEDTVSNSEISAVIAPNMAKQIVGFQAMMEYAAQNFPNLFSGYSLIIRESHQQGKADTSGTAKAMIRYFNALGVDFSQDQIEMERDPEVQRSVWKIPEDYIAGHGWHTYTLLSADHTVRFEFQHNINGRDVYALGTLDAVAYLASKLKRGSRGQVYTMVDVLKGS